MTKSRNILAQLIEEEELKSMAPGELRAMLAELDDQVVYGEEDAVEVVLPA